LSIRPNGTLIEVTQLAHLDSSTMSITKSQLFDQQLRQDESEQGFCNEADIRSPTASNSLHLGEETESLDASGDEGSLSYVSDEVSSSCNSSSSSIDSSSSMTEEDSGRSAEEGDTKGKDKGPGLFLSMEMVHLLRSHTSEGNLLTKNIVFENMIPQEVPRRNSECGRSTGIVYAVQSKSPMESHPGHANDEPKPKDVLTKILQLHGHSADPTSFSSLTTWVKGCTVGYSLNLMEAVRQNNLETIREMHQAGRNLQCCNKFQETILHAVARHGRTEILRFLVEEAGVSMRVSCDQGRTILHDGCWTATPSWDTISFVLHSHPEFLLIADRLGFTPLDYVPKAAWADWALFLENNKELVLP
jgi:Ankyrin repeats (3 copies)